MAQLILIQPPPSMKRFTSAVVAAFFLHSFTAVDSSSPVAPSCLSKIVSKGPQSHAFTPTIPTVDHKTEAAVGCWKESQRLVPLLHLHSRQHNESAFQGWTAHPNGRGTTDIIWGCCVTIFLCCWSVVCINVPPARWGRWRRIHEKILVTCMSGLGPEFTFQLALGQWLSARLSVQDFKQSGFQHWSMKHAFLADMGGFVLHAPDFVEFPLNARHVHYLVVKGYISYDSVGIDVDIINDKNKVNGLVRFITVTQILWFSLQCLARLLQHLTLTTMELSALAYIFCTLGTYFLWIRKPMDVTSTIVLQPNTSLANILIQAGYLARQPYRSTPLDFVDREHSSWYLYWTYWMNLVRKLRLLYPIKRGPIEMIPDDNFPPLSGTTVAVLILFQGTYAAVQICGWNYPFPTPLEQLLWRVSSLYIILSIVLFWIVDTYAWKVYPTLKRYLCKPVKPDSEMGYSNLCCARTPWTSSTARIRNNTSPYDTSMDIPLKALIPVTALGIGYCIARAYIFVEDWISLRALPPDAYDTVEWSALLPHF